MKRLVGNPESIETEYGYKSDPFEGKHYAFLVSQCYQDKETRGDLLTLLDLDQICRDALQEGYCLDYVDAYYAWEQYSNQESASWLIGANLSSCRKFLIEIEIPDSRSLSFKERDKEFDEINKRYLEKYHGT